MFLIYTCLIFHPKNTRTPEIAHELHLKSLVGIHDSLKCFIYHSVEKFIRSFSRKTNNTTFISIRLRKPLTININLL